MPLSASCDRQADRPSLPLQLAVGRPLQAAGAHEPDGVEASRPRHHLPLLPRLQQRVTPLRE